MRPLTRAAEPTVAARRERGPSIVFIHFEDRASDSPVVERVWRSHSERTGEFQSMASANWGVVVTRLRGETTFHIRGPETCATLAECPPEGEWLGIQFRPGSFMPLAVPGSLSDRRDLALPGSRRRFSLDGSSWEYPGFDNAEAFVERLLKKGLVVVDPVVVAALQEPSGSLPDRTRQRRFQRATGMSHATLRQIERARRATALLVGGRPVADVVFELGYYDQPHLHRSLRHYVGQTPAQLARRERQLSLLYNPDPA